MLKLESCASDNCHGTKPQLLCTIAGDLKRLRIPTIDDVRSFHHLRIVVLHEFEKIGVQTCS